MTTVATLNVAKNGFLFRFEETVGADGMFKETYGKIAVVSNADMSAKTPRWVKVEKTGPNIIEPALKPGARVLLAATQWSRGIKLDDGSYVWKSDENQVLGIED